MRYEAHGRPGTHCDALAPSFVRPVLINTFMFDRCVPDICFYAQTQATVLTLTDRHNLARDHKTGANNYGTRC